MKPIILLVMCLIPSALVSDYCRRHYCDGIRELRAQIAGGYEVCCQRADPAARESCLTDLGNNI